MSKRTWDERDEHQSLTKRARETLVALDRAPIAYGVRNFPDHFRELTGQGLAFHNGRQLTITDKGRDARERVA